MTRDVCKSFKLLLPSLFLRCLLYKSHWNQRKNLFFCMVANRQGADECNSDHFVESHGPAILHCFLYEIAMIKTCETWVSPVVKSSRKRRVRRPSVTGLKRSTPPLAELFSDGSDSGEGPDPEGEDDDASVEESLLLLASTSSSPSSFSSGLKGGGGGDDDARKTKGLRGLRCGRAAKGELGKPTPRRRRGRHTADGGGGWRSM